MTGTKQVSIHGVRTFIDPDDILVGKGAVAAGGSTNPMVVLPGSPNFVALWEDFVDTGTLDWTDLDGDTGAANTSTSQALTNGVWRLAISATNHPPSPANYQLLKQRLIWKANQSADPKHSRLHLGARVKIGTVSRSTPDRTSVFVGFTDTGAGHVPLRDTGAGVVAAASNAVGFLYGSSADTGWNGVAVNADTVGTQVVLDRTRPVSNVYDVLEVEVHRGLSDTGGNASFYINGKIVGTIASPIVTSRAMVPTVTIWQQDTGGGATVDIDWINVWANRDTGT